MRMAQCLRKRGHDGGAAIGGGKHRPPNPAALRIAEGCCTTWLIDWKRGGCATPDRAFEWYTQGPQESATCLDRFSERQRC
jgi:hypothetical protein